MTIVYTNAFPEETCETHQTQENIKAKDEDKEIQEGDQEKNEEYG